MSNPQPSNILKFKIVKNAALGAKVRATFIDGEPWFSLADCVIASGVPDRAAQRIAATLQLDEARRIAGAEVVNLESVLKAKGRVLRRHPRRLKTGSKNAPGRGKRETRGGARSAYLISEAGLNAIILASPQALIPGTKPFAFRRWITKDVIPALRRDGFYQARREHVARMNSVVGASEADAHRAVCRDDLEEAIKALHAHAASQGSTQPYETRFPAMTTPLNWAVTRQPKPYNKKNYGPKGFRASLDPLTKLRLADNEARLAAMIVDEIAARTHYKAIKEMFAEECARIEAFYFPEPRARRVA